MDNRRFWMLIIAFHALFFGKQVLLRNSMLQDSMEYLYAADNLLEHQTLYAWNLNHAYNPNWLTKRPFLYPSMLAVVKTATFGSDKAFFFILYLLQNLVSLLCIRLVLKMVRKFRPEIPYKHALIFVLLSFSQVIYANMVMSEIWLQLCLVSVVYLLIMYPLDARRLLFICLLLIAGMSLKPVLIFTAFCFPVFYLIKCFRSLRVAHVMLTLLPLCFYLSVCRINAARTGYFHYSSISNINLLHYNTYSMLLNMYAMEKADSIVDHINIEAKSQGSYAAQQAYIRTACSELISANLQLYTWLHFRGAIYCVIDPGRFDFTQFFYLPHRQNLIYETNKDGAFSRLLKSFMDPLGILLALLMVFNIFRVYAVLRFTRTRLSWELKLSIWFFPAYILFFTGPIGSSRFFMPLIPLVLLMFLAAVPQRKQSAIR